MSEMKSCPNCGTTNSNARDYEYWCLVNRFERLAVESGAIRDMVMLAENRLRCVAHGVSRGDSPSLCNSDHWEHVASANRLLTAAMEAKRNLK